MAGGGGRCEGPWLSTKATLWPALRVKSETVRMSWPRSFAAVRSTTMLGPAMAQMPLWSGSRVTQGTLMP